MIKKILKWAVIGFVVLLVVGAIAGNNDESFIGKYAYNATNDEYQGKIIKVKPCSNKPSLTCYVTDLGNVHNQYSGASPTEHPIGNVNVKDNISNPKEDLKYIYGSEYCILEDCISEKQESTQKVEQEKEIQSTTQPSVKPIPSVTKQSVQTNQNNIEIVVKKSSSDICHVPGTTYYDRTTNYTAYDSIDECLASGGRLPKR